MPGIERNWVKQADPTQSVGVLQMSSKEWRTANAVARMHIWRGDHPPFRLSKEELRQLYPKHATYFNHDLLVLPTEDGSYKVGAMASSEVYLDTAGQKVTEGILGHGAFGVVKLIQWEDGGVEAVKIEGAVEGAEAATLERQIMTDLGYLRATFVEKRAAEEEWIDGKRIKDILYTVQKRQVGIEMRNYFTSVNVYTMSRIKKYELGLKAAQAIEHLHDLNILHCDIKPANFMLNWEGDTAVVAAIDFGLSMRLKQGQTVVQDVPKGTPQYVAPEIREYEREQNGRFRIIRDIKGAHLVPLRGDGNYSKAADVFSLGIMFRDDLKLGAPESPLYNLVKRMTARDPEKRPSIHEVSMIMVNPLNYAAFKQLYGGLEKYSLAKKNSPTPFWSSRRISAKEQVAMVESLESVLNEYRRAAPSKTLVEKTVASILSILQENQKHHDQVTFARRSTFNVETLQSLPVELRIKVCTKLGIAATSPILKETSYAARKELAQKIKAYTPPPVAKDDQPQPSFK